jgi:hypothetical protein
MRARDAAHGLFAMRRRDKMPQRNANRDARSIMQPPGASVPRSESSGPTATINLKHWRSASC